MRWVLAVNAADPKPPVSVLVVFIFGSFTGLYPDRPISEGRKKAQPYGWTFLFPRKYSIHFWMLL
jgi:hypothetical protein